MPPTPISRLSWPQIERFLPWIVGNLFVLGLFGRDLVNFDGGLISTGAYWGRDFVNVWTAGNLLINDRLDILYDIEGYHAFQQTLFGPIGRHNYSYPPLVLPLMLPFALLPYGVALAAWLAVTGWLFIRAAEPWWRDASGLPSWMVLATPAALINIWAGHYGFLIGALFLFGWRLLDTRPLLAGLCFGLMAIKPHLAVLIPLILLLRGAWPTIFAAGATVVALAGSSAVLFGLERWIEYVTITVGVQAEMIDAGEVFFRYMSTSTATGMLQLGLPRDVALAVHVLQAVAAISLVVIATRVAAIRHVALLAATATFLVLPYAFNYDLVVSAIAAAMLIARGDLGALERRIALGGFMAAQVGMALSGQGLPGIPLLLLGLMIVQFRVAMREAETAPASRGLAVTAG